MARRNVVDALLYERDPLRLRRALLLYGWEDTGPAPDGRRRVWKGTPPDKGRRVQISKPGTGRKKKEPDEQARDAARGDDLKRKRTSASVERALRSDDREGALLGALGSKAAVAAFLKARSEGSTVADAVRLATEKKPAPAKKAKGDPAEVHAAIERMLAEPHRLTDEHLGDLKDNLQSLTKPQLAELRRKLKAKRRGANKGDEVDAIHGEVAGKKPSARDQRTREGLGKAKVPEKKSGRATVEQAEAVKQKHPGMLALFRDGDGKGYFVHPDDLKAVDKAGVPAEFQWADAEQHLRTLLRKGLRVAVMDEVPSEEKSTAEVAPKEEEAEKKAADPKERLAPFGRRVQLSDPGAARPKKKPIKGLVKREMRGGRSERTAGTILKDGVFTDGKMLFLMGEAELRQAKEALGPGYENARGWPLADFMPKKQERQPARVLGLADADGDRVATYILEGEGGRRLAVDRNLIDQIRARHPNATMHLTPAGNYGDGPVVFRANDTTVGLAMPIDAFDKKTLSGFTPHDAAPGDQPAPQPEKKPRKAPAKKPAARKAGLPKPKDLAGAEWRGLGNEHGNTEMLVARVGGRDYVVKQMQREGTGAGVESDAGGLARKMGLNVPGAAPTAPPPEKVPGWKGMRFAKDGDWVVMDRAAGRPATPDDLKHPRVRKAVVDDLLVAFALGNNDRNDANLLVGDDGSVSHLDWEPSFSDATDPAHYDSRSMSQDLPDETPLDGATLAGVLRAAGDIEATAGKYPHEAGFVEDPGSVGRAATDAARKRLDVLRRLAAMGSPTLGDFRRAMRAPVPGSPEHPTPVVPQPPGKEARPTPADHASGLAARLRGMTGGTANDVADDVIARGEEAHKGLTAAEFQEFAKELGLTVHGTRANMLKQFRDYVNRIAVSRQQTDF